MHGVARTRAHASDGADMEQATDAHHFESPPTAARRPRAPCLQYASHPFEEAQMRLRIHASIATGLIALALAGCPGMTHTEKSTVAGAAIGGGAGATPTGG